MNDEVSDDGANDDEVEVSSIKQLHHLSADREIRIIAAGSTVQALAKVRGILRDL